MTRLVILDRDGVINFESPEYIKSPLEWHPIPGSLEAIVKLNKKGIKVAIATNQGGVGRGYYDLEMLDKIHQKMQQALKKLGGHIDLIQVCPHHPDSNCECRKPKAGLIYAIIAHFNLNPLHIKIPFIGDSLRDLKAAQLANCDPILVLTGNGEETKDNLPPELQEIPIYSNLAKAINALIAEK